MAQPQPTGPKKVVLNSGDELFSEIRDLNFSGVGVVLSRRAKQISAAFEVINYDSCHIASQFLFRSFVLITR